MRSTALAVVLPFAFAYLVVVSLFIGGLIVLGYALNRLPWRPVDDRSYRAFLLGALDAVIRPFDALPAPEGR